jgi:hypothetical protein
MGEFDAGFARIEPARDAQPARLKWQSARAEQFIEPRVSDEEYDGADEAEC